MKLNYSYMFSVGGAHLVGQATTVLAQLALPAILISHIGPRDFGLYVACQAIGMFFALYDLGALQGLLNRILRKEIRLVAWEKLFNAVAKKLFLRGTGIFFVLFIVASFVTTLKIEERNNNFIIYTCILGIASTATTTFNLLSILRISQSKEGIGVILSNLARALEVSALLVAIVVSNSLYIGLACSAGVRVMLAMAAITVVLRETKDAKGDGAADVKRDVEETMRRGYKFLLQSASAQVSQNAVPPILLVLIGAHALAAFSTARTLSRVSLQGCNFVCSASASALTRRTIDSNAASFWRLCAGLIALTSSLSIAYAIVSTVFLDQINEGWLRGKLEIPGKLYVVFAIAGAGTAIALAFTTSLTALGSFNFQSKLAVVSPPATILIVALMAWAYGLTGASYALASSEILLCAGLLWATRNEYFKSKLSTDQVYRHQ